MDKVMVKTNGKYEFYLWLMGKHLLLPLSISGRKSAYNVSLKN